MKTVFTLLLVSIVLVKANAQNTTGREEYLIARTVMKGFSRSYLLFLDYSGAKGKDYIDPNEAVDDSDGHIIKFKSESAVLNYLADQSWILVSAMPVSYQGTSTETKYVFRRKITGEKWPIAKPTAE